MGDDAWVRSTSTSIPRLYGLDHACGLDDASFTTVARELGRPVGVEEVLPHAVAALEEVFGLSFEEQPAHEQLAAR
jgi:lipoate-protein ligase B